MNKRITLITLFDEKTLKTINSLVNKLDKKICKVPYGIDDENREKMDTLPFHFTISAWDKEYEEKAVKLLNVVNFSKRKMEVNQIKIMQGKNNSFVLFLAVKEQEGLRDIQTIIYNKLPNEKYNPIKFTFHITLHIDKDYQTVIRMKKELEKEFKSFEMEINQLGLFEIYPAKLIKKTSEFI
ncbi:MAG: 2'-5' RNA ligase family protein [Clostridia bacterium]